MKLQEWMKKNKISRKQLSEYLRYSINYVGRIVSGTKVPGKKMAIMINEYTNRKVTLEELGYKQKERVKCPCCGKFM